ncbi:response regulator transcription factor [Oceanicella sp. SM1341]|uniref:response regulator transcription factor n=1 Tax=Oceanicella sp. SM1341 TaxID=1548889 RepID=UPI000E51A049|nr:response regulator [Oceanicella sp. SM1341]
MRDQLDEGARSGAGPLPDAAAPVVAIVDDDEQVRRAMDSLLRSVGLGTRLYGSAAEFLARPAPQDADCLVVDVRMPRVSGLEFQARLAERGSRMPIIFVTGFGDIPLTVHAMKAGAHDVLTKPFREQDLLDSVSGALERSRALRAAGRERAALVARHESLTTREREVMQGVVEGLLNKQIAGRLGLSEITVKLHRASMLRKMETRTVADLVRIAAVLERDP